MSPEASLSCLGAPLPTTLKYPPRLSLLLQRSVVGEEESPFVSPEEGDGPGVAVGQQVALKLPKAGVRTLCFIQSEMLSVAWPFPSSVSPI